MMARPKVSVVIPTIGRSYFFEMAYKSALCQNYDSMEVVVVDYGKGRSIREIVEGCKDERVRYYKIKDPGRLEGYRVALSMARGDYIKLLLDDDMLLPNSIAPMVEVLDSEKDVTLVTSSRIIIDEENNVRGRIEAPFKGDTLVDGIEAGDIVLVNYWNYIGEPSTVLFRSKDLKEPFGRFRGKDALCNDDIASWLNLLLRGKLFYFSSPLSCFRKHFGQTQRKKGYRAKGMIDFMNHIFDGRCAGFLKDDIKFYEAVFRGVYTVCFDPSYLSEAGEADRATLLKLVRMGLSILGEAGARNLSFTV